MLHILFPAKQFKIRPEPLQPVIRVSENSSAGRAGEVVRLKEAADKISVNEI